MNKYLEQVAEFHRQFNIPVKDKQNIDDNPLIALRMSLLEEELNELGEALLEQNKTKVLDALCDLQYVLSGAILSFGFQTVFDDAFAETHRSNMSKACLTEEEAMETVEFYAKQGQNAYSLNNTASGAINVIRDDGKLLKSINYSKVDYTSFIEV